MQYIGGNTKETGCIFCNRLAADDDVQSMILFRGKYNFAIMNLFPYNTGHIMLVPNEHVASPEDASSEALTENASLLPAVLRALRRTLLCHGFNVGLNVGSVAGAGVAVHMHEHVVPRWNGDANFMPILANTTVIPELIPVTYAKLRAELARELDPARHTSVTWILIDPDGDRVWTEADGSLPVAEIEPDLPVWQSTVKGAAERGVTGRVFAWAGDSRADAQGDIALALQSDESSTAQDSFVAIAEALERLSSGDRQSVLRALSHR
jgi:ATP adenylyltransferase